RPDRVRAVRDRLWSARALRRRARARPRGHHQGGGVVSIASRRKRRPSLERVLFGLAGSVVLIGAALSALVSPWFLLLIAFVGVNQWAYVLAGDCPASLILRRVA